MKTLGDLPPEFHQLPDVQAIYALVNGLLTGTKRLVVESIPTSERVVNWDPHKSTHGYKHTLSVEDVNVD